jgi:hypothetical protein
MALSTVSGILTRIGMGKLGRLGLEPAQRYERAGPGELIHIDVKKLGRIARPGHRVLGRRSGEAHHLRRYHLGWEFVHVAIDDATRLAYVEVLADKKTTTAIGFLHRAVKHSASYGITVERLITDKAPPTAQPSTRSPVAPWESATSGPAPTDPRPTARPSDSSAPCSAAGPTARSTATATSATPRSPAGSTSTIAADHTAPSATSRPSLTSTS